MVFNSSTFILFFISFYVVFWWLNKKFRLVYRNAFILIASYFFYGWWDWRFLSLVFISSMADFLLGLLIHNAQTKRLKKLFLICSIVFNLGILGFFKYYNFFIDSLTTLLSPFDIETHFSTLQIILPVGISFYTFQTLSYTIDIYREKLKPTYDIISFFAFISFFPQLVAGPIERASNLLHQFFDKKTFNYTTTIEGLRLALWGFFKKIVIADNLGLVVDQIFNNTHEVNLYTTIIALTLFAFQIYCDFSGYSDIAIGIARMLGFQLMVNFSTPYFSKSLTEFWHRWHISLSSWFRDYVYIPLGGSKGTQFRIYFNLFITFLLSGFWHGAKITFIIWGVLHGITLILEKIIKFKPKTNWHVPLIFIITTFFWMPFRAKDFVQLKELIYSLSKTNIRVQDILKPIFEVHTPLKIAVLTLAFIVFILIESMMSKRDFNTWISEKHKLFRIMTYYAIAISILLLGNLNIKPYFIYFQF